jgi:hypothetical protein
MVMIRTLLLLLLFGQVSAGFSQITPALFKHHVIASPLPGPQEWGTGGFTLADFDKDGDLDVTISRRTDSARVYWYEYLRRKWFQHYLGRADEHQLGAIATDINLDGWPDLVMGRYWFENPAGLQLNPDSPFIRHSYFTASGAEIHDIGAADINNDGRKDIIAYCQNEGNGTLRLYNTEDPENWLYTDIVTEINGTVNQPAFAGGIHGGFSPMGAGDLDGDSYADIVMPNGWYKNPGSRHDNRWQLNPWPFPMGRFPNPYGVSIRSWICDLDSDGDSDIVYTDCDTEESAGYWLENRRGGNRFIRHPLPAPGLFTGSFHSLIVADFDQDGDPDIFSGEQEDPDPGMKQPGLKERGFIWENTGSRRSPAFEIKIIQTDNPGWHDALAGDVDGDGDIDIVSKIWNKDGEYYHADYWENQLINNDP